jgi:hypothetical protein
MELESNRKLFPDYFSSILDGATGGLPFTLATDWRTDQPTNQLTNQLTNQPTAILSEVSEPALTSAPSMYWMCQLWLSCWMNFT